MAESISRTFTELVALKYQLYNGLFLTLPLDAVEQTGLLLPLLEVACQDGLEAGRDPAAIVEDFFSAISRTLPNRISLGFCSRLSSMWNGR